MTAVNHPKGEGMGREGLKVDGGTRVLHASKLISMLASKQPDIYISKTFPIFGPRAAATYI